LGNVAQRLEAAGALGVVLEEEGVDVEAGEHPLGDENPRTRRSRAGALEVAAAVWIATVMSSGTSRIAAFTASAYIAASLFGSGGFLNCP